MTEELKKLIDAIASQQDLTSETSDEMMARASALAKTAEERKEDWR